MKLKAFNFVKYLVYVTICKKDLDKYYSVKSSIFRKLSRLGFYESEQIELLKKFVSAGDSVIDGGANFGVYTDELIAAVGVTGKVIAVEPLTSISNYLATRFHLKKNVFIYTKALSGCTGNTVKIYIPFIHKDLPEPALASLVKPSVGHSTNLVTTTTLDELASVHGKISFIKLDVEGHELEALRGGITCLLNDRPVVQFEVNNMEVTYQDYLHFADQVNYSLFEVVGGGLYRFDPAKISNRYNFYLMPVE